MKKNEQRAASVAEEKELLRTIEASDRIVAVNLFNRNAWYHEEIQSFIRRGQIGDLAVLDISHQTSGLMPTEGHQPEGPYGGYGGKKLDVMAQRFAEALDSGDSSLLPNCRDSVFASDKTKA